MNTHFKTIIFYITFIILFFSNKIFCQDSLSVKSKNDRTDKIHFQFALAPLRIFNNRFAIGLLANKQKFNTSIVIDYQKKNLPFKKPLIFQEYDFDNFLGCKLGVFRKYNLKKVTNNFGIYVQKISNSTINRTVVSANEHSGLPKIENYFDEKNSIQSILLTYICEIKVIKKIGLNVSPMLGYSRIVQFKSNLRNNVNNDYIEKQTLIKNKFAFELYFFITYEF